MALIVKDRVQEISTTVGTGTLTLGGAVLGFQSFAAIGDSNTTYYVINDPITGDWEVGIGTYTASGTTLSRDTVLSSSNGGSLVPFVAGTKNVFCTYPSERAVYLDNAGSYPVQNTFDTLNATTAVLTAGTVATTPANNTDIANKQYVDTLVATGIHFHAPVRVESPINLNATYNQPGGAGVGVGATLTNAGTQTALVIDGVTVSVADRVLVYQQATQTQNGIYVVTDVGSGSTNWILTRASDADTYVINSANGLSEGSTVFVQQGATGAGETYTCNTSGVITFGTTNITFAQISSAQIYSAGTGLALSGTTFSIADTGTAGTYGGANSVPVFTTNAQGQVTGVTPTTIAISSAAVSGLAASATTDTTNASNISSGTLGTSRLSGSYTGITGVGALAAGSLASGFTAVSAPLGGTGQTSYAVGDILYANTTTSLAKLADVAVGNALISGGVGSAPSYGKIGLATHVNGTLPIANGGTNGSATPTAGAVAYGTGSAYGFSSAGSSGQALLSGATGAPTWGTLGIAAGGTGETSRQAAMNALAGAVTSGQYLRGDGTNVVMSAIQAADVPTLNQNTTGSAATLTTARTIQTNLASTAAASFNGSANITPGVTGTLPVANGGTGRSTLTANNVILGNGTTAVNFVAPGTSGNVLTSDGTTWTSGSAPGFPAGTLMLFQQTAAPTGWTKQTTHDNKALRVVSGTASSGGSVAFTTAFAAGSTGATTLTIAQIPSHNHAGPAGSEFSSYGSAGVGNAAGPSGFRNDPIRLVSSTGGGGSHTHSLALDVQYVDLIIASKD